MTATASTAGGAVAGAGSELTHLWQPLDIGPTRVKHRIMQTAQTVLYADDHVLSDKHIAYYTERAKGGTALLITEQQAGHPLSKGSFYMGCSAHDKRAIPQYAKLAESIAPYGAKQFVQLFAAGVHDKGTMVHDNWHPLWAASRVASVVHREVPMVMEKSHILDVVKAFGESADNVRVSGLNGVEIHGAHSYLVGQFFSKAYNFRTDEYGGSTANRCRFAIEIAESIRAKVGREITVGLRLSYDEFMGDAGITGEESDEALDILAGTGLFDFFNISGGGYHTLHLAVANMNVQQGFMIPFGKKAKAVVGDRAKVFIIGRILDPRMANEAIASGSADMVAMTRAQMADPQLVTKAQQGRYDEINKCIGANVCLARAFDQREVVCVMNPAVSREREWGIGTLKPAAGGGKRVIVVGGGPVGLHVAKVAAERGHKVVLLERDAELGGHLRTLAKMPTRTEWGVGIENLVKPLARLGVDVRLNHEATPDVLKSGAPDTVVIATGSRWDKTGFSQFHPGRAGIPGAEQANVLDLGSAAKLAVADPTALGKKVLIFDESAGYWPLGLAEVLSDAGIDVDIVTPHLFLGEDTLKTGDFPHNVPRLQGKGVRMAAQLMIDRIEGAAVHLFGVWGGPPVTIGGVDTVVLAMMKSPVDELYFAVREQHPEVHRVGDAVAPRKLEAVMYEAEKLGREI